MRASINRMLQMEDDLITEGVKDIEKHFKLKADNKEKIIVTSTPNGNDSFRKLLQDCGEKTTTNNK